MNAFIATQRTGRRAAVAASIGFVGIAVFQLALAVGAPWGHAAWGGAHAHLSTAERSGSAVAVLVWTAATLVVLGRAGFLQTRKPAFVFRWGPWLLAAVSVIAALLNFASESRWENAIFGPLAVAIAVACIIVARSAPIVGRAVPKATPKNKIDDVSAVLR